MGTLIYGQKLLYHEMLTALLHRVKYWRFFKCQFKLAQQNDKNGAQPHWIFAWCFPFNMLLCIFFLKLVISWRFHLNSILAFSENVLNMVVQPSQHHSLLPFPSVTIFVALHAMSPSQLSFHQLPFLCNFSTPCFTGKIHDPAFICSL
jgi:hypothetical protein